MTWFGYAVACLILAILVARAIWVTRAEMRQPNGGRPRGVDPGDGYTEIFSDYSSGLGGGNQLTTRVPKDPQAYAKTFVPRHKS
ncbi:MAG: hypothetical protein AAFY65_00985 [Pseudomonadota bacterium]